MSERIRYRKVSDSTVESVQTYSHATNGAKYKIRLVAPSTEDRAYKWLVLDAGTEIPAVTGRHVNRNKAQLEVRSALSELGVGLMVEKRKERKKKVATQ